MNTSWNLSAGAIRATLAPDNSALTLFVTGAAPGMDFDLRDLGCLGVSGAHPAWTNLMDVRQDDGEISITVEDESRTLRLKLNVTLFADHPFIRCEGTVENVGTKSVDVDGCRFLSLHPHGGLPMSLFHVEQFSAVYRRDFFRPVEMRLIAGRAAQELHMGSHPSQHWRPTSCSWFAMRTERQGWYEQPAPDGPGLVCGVEFNGKSTLRAWADAEKSHVTLDIDALHHRLNPGAVFEIPAVFLGRYDGDWDEAAYRTQRFAEAHVHPSMPDSRYPWAQYNSWAYDQNINEAQQMEAIDRAAKLGLELVVLDLGWARNIGDWRPNPEKFPRGLKPLSDRARSHGMRFGVHIALAQCAFDAPAAKEHPDWLINPVVDYFGAAALCLGHTPCRDWLIEQISALIRNESIDYIVQDGEDMVKACHRSDHTHAPGDSNYSGSQKGLDVVIGTLRERFPHLIIENCEDGGCMMTYKMARLYHTSITVDNIDTYSTRQGVFGASYPFSPRYSVRYMQDAPTHYTLYSSIFGGPLIFMHRVTEWNDAEMEETRRAVEVYKRIRTLVRDAKILHLIRPSNNIPGGGWGWDAIQAVSPDQTRSIVMVYRAQGESDEKRIHPRGLCAERQYRIQFGEGGSSSVHTGAELEQAGVVLELDEFGADILTINAI